MRGRAILLSLLSLSLLANEAFPACSWVPRYSGAFRTTAYDVAVDSGGFVWVATGYGIQLIDGATLTFADSKGIAGSTRVVATNGNLAYVGSGSRMFVVRRNNRALEIVRSFDAGGTVNDIIVSSYLFVATANGIAHFDLIDPLNPIRTTVILSTSKPNVTSLSLAGTTLYAADGDLTVEVFSLALPSLPQQTGTIEALPRSVAVHATPPNGLIYVSDDLGQNTDVFTSITSKYARIPFGSLAFAQLTSTSAFMAGSDRTVRAVDITSVTRVAELFEQQLAPTGGTSNRIFAMARSGNNLYVAAGDIGLVVYDVSDLSAPVPLVSYADGAKTSAVVSGQKAFFTDGAGNFAEYTINRNGLSLTPSRTWAATAPSIIQDYASQALLVSDGATVRLWGADLNPPAWITPVTFRTTVKAAVDRVTNMLVLLEDGSLWEAPPGGAPVQVNLGGAKISYLARGGAGVALGELTDEGKTIVRYYEPGALISPRTFTIDGAAIGGLATDGARDFVALFTFRGINIIDLDRGTVRVLPDSHRRIPKRLLFPDADHLLVLSDRMLSVWHVRSGVLLREIPLPANAVAIGGEATIAAIASSEGAMAVDYARDLPNGRPVNANAYYEKAVESGDYLYLFGGGRLDVYWTGDGSAPRFVTSTGAAGAIDIAALPKSFFTLSGDGTVTAYSTAGVATAQKTIDEGADAQPLSIWTIGDAVWVSFVKGCQSGTCQKKTLILDPKTLAITSFLDGGVVDVTTAGTSAFAIFDQPAAVRVFDITSPLFPAQTATVARPTAASAISHAGGKIYVAGDKVYSYNAQLVPQGDSLAPVTSSEQRLAIDGDCAVVTGRGASPQFYTLPSWTPAPSALEVPSSVQSIATSAGRIVLLTEHSIELWTTTPPPSPKKRRAAR